MSVEYILWALKVIEQFCEHLGIKCFVIPYPGEEVVEVEMKAKKSSGSRSKSAVLPESPLPLSKQTSRSPSKTTPKKTVAFTVVERENEVVGLRRSPRNKNK
jgi:hypothetical protein